MRRATSSLLVESNKERKARLMMDMIAVENRN
jgi:hypothetical protein